MNKRVRAIAAVLACLVLAIGLSACGGEKEAAKKETGSKPVVQLMQIGDKSDDATVITLDNETGQALTAVAVQQPGAEAYDADLTQVKPLKNGKKAKVNVVLPADPVTTQQTTESGEVLEVTEYPNIKFTLENGTAYEIHNINLADISSATLKLDGDYVYLEYKDLNGTDVNTLETEKAYREQQQAAADAAAQAAAAQQQEAAAAQQAQQQAQQSSSQQSAPAQTQQSAPAQQQAQSAPAQSTPSSNNSSAGAVDAANGGGDEAGCADGVIFE